MADIHKAIRSLYSSVVTINGNTQSDIIAFDSNGDEVTINWSNVNSWTDPEQYKIDRKAAYPEIGEQLDKLWHDIDNGTLTKSGDFYTAINTVKTNNPKPSN
jgi:hypothetical protein